MISNKTTVIGAYQSDCSIRESQSECSIRVYEFQKGVSVEILKPPGSATGHLRGSEERNGAQKRIKVSMMQAAWSCCGW